MKNLLLLFLTLPYSVRTFAQTRTCTEIRDGVFYSYPKNSSKQYQLIRKGDIQTEKDLSNGDSTLWKITWLNDCTYSLAFISGGAKLTDEIKTFAKSHSLITKIEAITADFYAYHIYVDKVAGKYLLADTIWFQKKSAASNGTLFEAVPSNTSMKKINFSSKSPFALLYVYRPDKFIARKVGYVLYFDENIMCTSANGSGYIFKILKEGDFNLSARIYNEKDVTITVHIKFGEKVYVRSDFKTFSLNTNGLRPKLLLVDAEKGSEEFSSIEVQ